MDQRTANGKNLYIKVVGTLSGNASLAMPASTTGGNANRVFFVEDGTTRGGASDSFTVTLLNNWSKRRNSSTSSRRCNSFSLF